METFAAFGQPVCVNARTSHRLDQLVLRAVVVERKPQRPLSRFPTVFATLSPAGPAPIHATARPRVARRIRERRDRGHGRRIRSERERVPGVTEPCARGYEPTGPSRRFGG